VRICATCTHLRYDLDRKEDRMYRCDIGLEKESDDCSGWSPFLGEAS